MGSTQAIGAASRLSASTLRRVVQEGGADDLARRAVKGDRRAFSALMTTYKEGLYRFVRRRTRDPEEAYDIVQEAFVSAWSAIARFDPDRPFGAWLRSIALNKCRDRARRAIVRHMLLGSCPASAAECVRDQSPTPEDDLIARDELAALARAMAALPSHLREALTLTAVDGMSQAAASAVLGCSVKSVEYRVHRAREIVAQAIGLDSRS
jgi:RNA polymerase sigma-70 factor (ECF subfamily)